MGGQRIQKLTEKNGAYNSDCMPVRNTQVIIN